MIISNFLKSVYEKDVLLFRLGLFHFIIFALLFLPLASDDRLIEGINPWIKPMKRVPNKSLKQLLTLFPNAKEDDLETLDEIITDRELEELLEAHGIEPK